MHVDSCFKESDLEMPTFVVFLHEQFRRELEEERMARTRLEQEVCLEYFLSKSHSTASQPEILI